ncbi:MAG TPA: hypothetical protein VEK57_13410 [Thermoanaerobaculia bacterium]|nr:hypothetical protein [Thermoanaerobaculia bacterium]
MIGSIGSPELILIFVVVVVVIWPATRICAKAGYSPWLGVVIMIPVANIILLWYLALAEWPSRKAAG